MIFSGVFRVHGCLWEYRNRLISAKSTSAILAPVHRCFWRVGVLIGVLHLGPTLRLCGPLYASGLRLWRRQELYAALAAYPPQPLEVRRPARRRVERVVHRFAESGEEASVLTSRRDQCQRAIPTGSWIVQGVQDAGAQAEEVVGAEPVALPVGLDLERSLEHVESLVVLLSVRRHAGRWRHPHLEEHERVAIVVRLVLEDERVPHQGEGSAAVRRKMLDVCSCGRHLIPI